MSESGPCETVAAASTEITGAWRLRSFESIQSVLGVTHE